MLRWVGLVNQLRLRLPFVLVDSRFFRGAKLKRSIDGSVRAAIQPAHCRANQKTAIPLHHRNRHFMLTSHASESTGPLNVESLDHLRGQMLRHSRNPRPRTPLEMQIQVSIPLHSCIMLSTKPFTIMFPITSLRRTTNGYQPKRGGPSLSLIHISEPTRP